MATIRKDILIDAAPADVWAAVRDVGSAHTRLVPGVLADTRMERDARGVTRIVTFVHGMVARELIISLDDEERRLAYAWVGDQALHHNASMQVYADGIGTRLVWITDLLPDELAVPIEVLIDQGCAAMTRTLRRQAA